MKVHTVAVVALLLGAFALSAEEKGKDDKPKEKDKEKAKAKAYKTPQEVFDAFVAAYNNLDTKALVGCLAPEAIKETAGKFALQGVQMRALLDVNKDEKVVKRWKGVFDVLDKHGLTEKATKDVKLGKSSADREKAQATLVVKIKDQAAFLVDYQAALDKQGPKVKGEEIKPKLTDVKIDGDKATGTVVVTVQEKEEKEEVTFTKVADSWKINPNPKPAKDEGKDKDKDKKDKEK